MAALGKVSEGPHSSTDSQLLDLQVAGLQGFANTIIKKKQCAQELKTGTSVHIVFFFILFKLTHCEVRIL